MLRYSATACRRSQRYPTTVARRRQPSSGRIEASSRAVAILDALADAGEIGTNELARRTGLPASTVSRQLGTLAATGLVEQDGESGRYRLGIHVVRLANAVLARLDVRRIARPHLEELVRITGETATLHVPGEEDAVTVDFVPSAHFIQHVTQLGRPSIAHATSAGKVMLAFTDRPLPRGPLRAYTPRTITEREGARRRDRARARAGLRRGVRGARAGPRGGRRTGVVVDRRARRDRRAPGPDRALRRAARCAPRSRRCSSGRGRSRRRSAGCRR